jgi:ABC-type antimicrobial peptide transport system permease subunit
VWKVAFSEDGGLNGLWRPDVPVDPEDRGTLVRWRPVTPNYFGMAGMRLQRGRLFTAEDREGEPITVISQAAADAMFPGEDPIGMQVATSMEGPDVPLRVIGVVEDLKLAGLDRASPAVAYRPYAQLDEILTKHQLYQRWIVVRTANTAPTGMAATIRQAVRDEDPTALFADYVAMPTAISNSLAARRATMTLLAVFALSAVALGAIGIYGVMAYSVRQRAREISIRVALGATQNRVIKDILGDSLKVAGGGIALGLLLTMGAAGAVRQFLFEVDAFDPVVLAVAASSAVLVAVSASLLPAWRAAQADPATTLGSDE